MRAVIAAAGTGGHINPGIAIAEKIMSSEKNSKVIFIGTGKKIERDLIEKAGYELKTIESKPVYRKFNLENIKNCFKTFITAKNEAKKILKKFKPKIVIGTGGYICVSVCLAAKELGIPYILHESNAFPGVATKLNAKNAKAVCLGFKEAKNRLNSDANTVFTGTPTKIKKLNLSNEEKEKIKLDLGLNNNIPLVLIFGGSQGARSINKSAEDLIIHMEKDEEKNISISNDKKEMKTIDFNEKEPDFQIIWSCGQGNFDNLKKSFKENGLDIENLRYSKVLPYIYNMEEIMNICDIVVSRSGAMTITEIEKIGKPSILIPFPYAAENHQEINARVLEKNKASKVILDKDLNYEILKNTILMFIKDSNKLEEMGENANKLYIKDPEDKIYEQIIKYAKKD